MHSVFVLIIVRVFILCAIRWHVMHWLVFIYWYAFKVWCSSFRCNQSHLCVDYRASQSCMYPLLAGNCLYPNIVIYVKWHDPKIIMVMGWWRVKGHQEPEHNYSTHWETTDRYLENSHTFSQILPHWYLIYAACISHAHILWQHSVVIQNWNLPNQWRYDYVDRTRS